MIMRIGRETHTRKKTYIDCILTASCHVVVFSVKKNEKKEQKCVFIEHEGKRERERERERRGGIEQKRDKNNYLF